MIQITEDDAIQLGKRVLRSYSSDSSDVDGIELGRRIYNTAKHINQEREREQEAQEQYAQETSQ